MSDKDDAFPDLFRGLFGQNPEGSGLPSLFSGEWFKNLPRPPSGWSKSYHDRIIARADRRINQLQERLDAVTEGRVIPGEEQVTIGSGRRFTRLAVLFLDICGFSGIRNWTDAEQKHVLALMNIFMAEMLNIVNDYGGTFEKNTGDGLMAYFGEGASDDAACVKPAVEAAVVMHYFNDKLLTPWLQSRRVEPLRFRIGIHVGPVTIARVAAPRASGSMVAIGTPANIANKLMKLIPDGGVCIGQEVYSCLPNNWQSSCRLCDRPTGFVYELTGLPVPAWELNYRLTSAPI